jgi:UDP-3-O-[3-hydroxymyristoyl] glucosamine N-acyltransferase
LVLGRSCAIAILSLHIIARVHFALDANNVRAANRNVNVAAIITTKEFVDEVDTGKGLIRAGNPQLEFYLIHNRLCESGRMTLIEDWGVHGSAQIHDSVNLPLRCKIGKGVIIEANAYIEELSVIGDYTYIGVGAVVGARGMHRTYVDGKNIRFFDAGGVKIGRNCEILANATIQRSYFREYTIIGNDVKIGPGANVGHGCEINHSTVMAGNSVLAGYCQIGRDAWIGPNSTVAHMVKIGDNARVNLGSVVVKNVAAAAEVSGNFAVPHKIHVRNFTKSLLENKK